MAQTCSEQSRTIAPIALILICSDLTIFRECTVEEHEKSVIIDEIYDKKAFLRRDNYTG